MLRLLPCVREISCDPGDLPGDGGPAAAARPVAAPSPPTSAADRAAIECAFGDTSVIWCPSALLRRRRAEPEHKGLFDAPLPAPTAPPSEMA